MFFSPLFSWQNIETKPLLITCKGITGADIWLRWSSLSNSYTLIIDFFFLFLNLMAFNETGNVQIILISQIISFEADDDSGIHNAKLEFMLSLVITK